MKKTFRNVLSGVAMAMAMNVSAADSAIISEAETVPVGTLYDYVGGTPPLGYLLCDGSAVSRTEYKRLFAVIGERCGKCDDSTKFLLPDFRQRVAQGRRDDEVAGTPVESGIPEFYGSAGLYVYASGARPGVPPVSPEGAFLVGVLDSVGNTYWSGSANKNGSWSPSRLKVSAANGEMKTDGTRRNDVYGKSDTVQPAAILVTKIIKY